MLNESRKGAMETIDLKFVKFTDIFQVLTFGSFTLGDRKVTATSFLVFGFFKKEITAIY